MEQENLKMEELRPCPWCDKSDKQVYNHNWSSKMGDWEFYWGVRCIDCGVEVRAQTKELAIQKWNRRIER